MMRVLCLNQRVPWLKAISFPWGQSSWYGKGKCSRELWRWDLQLFCCHRERKPWVKRKREAMPQLMNWYPHILVSVEGVLLVVNDLIISNIKSWVCNKPALLLRLQSSLCRHQKIWRWNQLSSVAQKYQWHCLVLEAKCRLLNGMVEIQDAQANSFKVNVFPRQGWLAWQRWESQLSGGRVSILIG